MQIPFTLSLLNELHNHYMLCIMQIAAISAESRYVYTGA